LVKDWPNLPEDLVLGNPTGLAIDSNNNIMVFHRGSRVWEEPFPNDKIQKNQKKHFTIFCVQPTKLQLTFLNGIELNWRKIKKRNANKIHK
jgi:hypothetical protein